MSARLLSTDVRSQVLEPAELAASTIKAGTPVAALNELAELAGLGIGVWELTEGTVTDVETDEVFIVLAGRGTVEFTDGEVLDLAPGVAVRLTAGEHTVWTVHETIRKIYVA